MKYAESMQIQIHSSAANGSTPEGTEKLHAGAIKNSKNEPYIWQVKDLYAL